MLYIKLNGITNAATWYQIFDSYPPTPRVGSNSTFSHHGYFACQIKGNHKCSNMEANSLPADPRDPCQKVKIQTFSEHGHVAYQTKGNPKFSNMVANILPAAPPGGGVKRTKLKFFKTWSCCIFN